MDKNLILRLISGIVYIVLIAAGTTLHPYGFIFTLFLLLAFCTYEMTTVLKFDSKIWMGVTLLVLGYFFYTHALDFLTGSEDFKLLTKADYSKILKASLFFIAVYTLFFSAEELSNDQARLIFYVSYLGIPFYLAMYLPDLTHIKAEAPIYCLTHIQEEAPMTLEVLFIFVLLWCSDSFAYVFGRLFGKHPMAPTISAKKTWEGLAGGMLCTILVGFLLQYYTHILLKGNWFHISIIVAIFAPLGDLAESKLKRTFNIKDSGSLIPGHGGFLDRLDSFFITIPAVYLYYIILSL